MMEDWGGWGWGSGVVALAKRLFSVGNHDGDAGKRPLDTLKERYARGEITREQYQQKWRDLES